MRRNTIYLHMIAGVSVGLLLPLTSTLFLLMEGDYSLTLQNILLVQRLNPLAWMMDTAPLLIGLLAWFVAVRQVKIADLENELAWQISDKERLASELEHQRSRLEQRFEKRLGDLKLATQISRDAAELLDLDSLLEKSVNLIADRYGFYHAGIFLLDQQREFAVLCAASSEGGKNMLDRQYKLQLGSSGNVAKAVETGEPCTRLDIRSDEAFIENPDLPQSRSGAAFPLLARNTVIGVLDIQSEKSNVFNVEEITILQSLADQLALAIDNTRLLTRTQTTVDELTAINRRLVVQAWQPWAARSTPGFIFDRGKGIKPVYKANPREAAANDKAIESPILMGGQLLGKLTLQRGAGDPNWTKSEIELLDAICAQLGLALENARLVDEAQAQAKRETLVGDISTRLWASANVETIVHTTIEEICSSLNLNQAVLELEAPAYPG